MQPDCEECQRLWRDYGAAILAHVAIDSKLRLAALSHESEKIAILTLAAEDAQSKREFLREAIRKHDEVTGHANRGSAAEPTT